VCIKGNRSGPEKDKGRAQGREEALRHTKNAPKCPLRDVGETLLLAELTRESRKVHVADAGKPRKSLTSRKKKARGHLRKKGGRGGRNGKWGLPFVGRRRDFTGRDDLTKDKTYHGRRKKDYNLDSRKKKSRLANLQQTAGGGGGTQTPSPLHAVPRRERRKPIKKGLKSAERERRKND